MGEADRAPPHHKMDTTNELQISSAELKKHSTRQDCWVAVHSKVWDLTDFLDEHPGGAKSKLNVTKGMPFFFPTHVGDYDTQKAGKPQRFSMRRGD